MSGARRAGGVDLDLEFDEAARKLFASQAHPSAHNLPTGDRGHAYNDMDALWVHPYTKGVIYVGNDTAARSMAILNKYKVTNVVNCTDTIPCYHEAGSAIRYLRFPVAYWMSGMNSRDPKSVVCFFLPLFNFITAALHRGESVLIHCLAGAHRAGTTGVITLMYYGNIIDRVRATREAKALRSFIDPIGSFPQLLERFQRTMEAGIMQPYSIAYAEKLAAMSRSQKEGKEGSGL